MGQTRPVDGDECLKHTVKIRIKTYKNLKVYKRSLKNEVNKLNDTDHGISNETGGQTMNTEELNTYRFYTMIVGMTDQEFAQFLKELRGSFERGQGGALDG